MLLNLTDYILLNLRISVSTEHGGYHAGKYFGADRIGFFYPCIILFQGQIKYVWFRLV